MYIHSTRSKCQGQPLQQGDATECLTLGVQFYALRTVAFRLALRDAGCNVARHILCVYCMYAFYVYTSIHIIGTRSICIHSTLYVYVPPTVADRDAKLIPLSGRVLGPIPGPSNYKSVALVEGQRPDSGFVFGSGFRHDFNISVKKYSFNIFTYMYICVL